MSPTSQRRAPGSASTPPSFFLHQSPGRGPCNLGSVGLWKQVASLLWGGRDGLGAALPPPLHRLLLSPTSPQLSCPTPATLTHLCKNVKVPSEAPFWKLLSTQFPGPADCQKSFFSEFLLTHRGTLVSHLLTPLGGGVARMGLVGPVAGFLSMYIQNQTRLEPQGFISFCKHPQPCLLHGKFLFLAFTAFWFNFMRTSHPDLSMGTLPLLAWGHITKASHISNSQ